MRYEIAVCDDNTTEREYLISLIIEWSDKTDISVRLEFYSAAGEMIFTIKPWDIVLLDIEMGGMSGVELARILRESDERMQIVFVTGYSDYIAHGYDVAALQYLMKPVSKEKVFCDLRPCGPCYRKGGANSCF